MALVRGSLRSSARPGPDGRLQRQYLAFGPGPREPGLGLLDELAAGYCPADTCLVVCQYWAESKGVRMGSVVVLPTGEASTTRQGLRQFEGVSAESVGSRALCAHLHALPPGGRAKAHRHAGHETAIYLMEGRVVLWFGEQLESRIDFGPGDFVYIPPDVPHVPVNASETEWARGVVARTDPKEQESVELLPALDGLPHLVP